MSNSKRKTAMIRCYSAFTIGIITLVSATCYPLTQKEIWQVQLPGHFNFVDKDSTRLKKVIVEETQRIAPIELKQDGAIKVAVVYDASPNLKIFLLVISSLCFTYYIANSKNLIDLENLYTVVEATRKQHIEDMAIAKVKRQMALQLNSMNLEFDAQVKAMLWEQQDQLAVQQEIARDAEKMNPTAQQFEKDVRMLVDRKHTVSYAVCQVYQGVQEGSDEHKQLVAYYTDLLEKEKQDTHHHDPENPDLDIWE